MKAVQNLSLDALLDRAFPEPNTGCWLWTGDMNRNGYGRVRVKKRRIAAHRVIYQLVVGPIKRNRVLDHRVCQTRCCVNPAHMEPVSGKINTLRGNGPSAHAAKRTACVNGHPFTPENTYCHSGRRDCRACRKARRAK